MREGDQEEHELYQLTFMRLGMFCGGTQHL